MNELEYQEFEIERLLTEMGNNFEDIRINKEIAKSMVEPYDLHSSITDLELAFCYYAKRLYKFCYVYFESRGLFHYLEKFNAEVEPLLIDKKKILEGKYDPESEQVHSIILEIFWSYIFPFPFTEDKGNEAMLKLTGLLYLENILESTGVIIKEIGGPPPNSESQVCKAVKIVTKAVFPTAIFPTESFQKTAKCYIPDILLPTLNCAVEYKYAENEKRLIETIDQILADVKGYSNNRTYKLFYAVFYVRNNFITKSRFETIWKEKEFPENWKWIIVHGK